MADFENSSLAAKVFEQAAEIAALQKRVEEGEQQRDSFKALYEAANMAFAEANRQLEDERKRLNWWIANDTACLMKTSDMFAVYKDGECLSIWYENPRYSLDYAARNAARPSQ